MRAGRNIIHQPESCTLSILCGIDGQRLKADGDWRDLLQQLKCCIKNSSVGSAVDHIWHNHFAASKTARPRVIDSVNENAHSINKVHKENRNGLIDGISTAITSN
jgi:hypothetical protein